MAMRIDEIGDKDAVIEFDSGTGIHIPGNLHPATRPSLDHETIALRNNERRWYT